MTKQFTVTDFFRRFPDDESCLNHLMQVRYGSAFECPKCAKFGKFSRITGKPAFQCAWCGHHVHPMAGTPFENTRTPLQKWFYVMYLFTTTRHGVPAKEIQRQLSVTYKCAWRMGHEIRKYLGQVDGDDGLSGHIEIDETFVGGKTKRGQPDTKSVVFGMLERGGMLMTKVVPDRKKVSLLPLIRENIAPGSTITTDELSAYRQLKNEGFDHTMVEHGRKQYVQGIHHVNGLEGFWGHLKQAIKGTHVSVSEKHLPEYLAEFEFRYNMRKHPEKMFARLLLSF